MLSETHYLKDIEVEFKGRKDLKVESTPKKCETHEAMFVMQDFQMKGGENVSTIMLTGGEQATLPLTRASIIQKRDSSFKSSPAFQFSNERCIKSAKEPKTSSKGCGCTGGKGCTIFWLNINSNAIKPKRHSSFADFSPHPHINRFGLETRHIRPLLLSSGLRQPLLHGLVPRVRTSVYCNQAKPSHYDAW